MEQIICENCLSHAEKFEENSIDLIVTSPPYAEQRKSQYGGIPEVDYPTWTADWCNAYRPALKENGSIAIVIRPHIHNGQISDYVLRTRLELRKTWIEAEELIWIKPNSPPLGHIKRPRRAWEHILWFSKTNQPFCDPKANGRVSDRVGFESKKGVGDYKQGTSKAKQGIARCTDYAEVGTSGVDRSSYNTHPAQYPERLAAWIIRLLCPLNGIVVDPFVGSGTTLAACEHLNQTERYDLKSYGVDICEEYCEIARRRLAEIRQE